MIVSVQLPVMWAEMLIEQSAHTAAKLGAYQYVAFAGHNLTSIRPSWLALIS
jgi:hypothetical protein